MNRTIAPQIRPINAVELTEPTILKTKSGVPIFMLGKTNDDAVKIALQFAAGKVHQKKALQASMAFNLLLSGTPIKASKEIEESIDHLGGYTNFETQIEDATLTIFALSKNTNAILETIFDAIANVNYNAKEFELYVKRSRQSFQVGLEKVSTLARRNFMHTLFKNSPVGAPTQLEDYDKITHQDCIDFYEEHIRKGLMNISIVGNIDKKTLENILTTLDDWKNKNKKINQIPSAVTPITLHTAKKNAVQSAIRIGKILFSPTHEDYMEFKVLNTILGGYFGSRLMSNIREDKGYTYGIGSGISSVLDTGFFFIGTEVAAEVRENAIAEIKKEIEVLQTNLIEEAELELVKKYISGQFLKNTDGAFAMMDRLLFLNHYNLTPEFYKELLNKTTAIKPKKIQELAIKYLKWEEMNVISVG